MSDTKIDLPKIAQMLDAGWLVRMFKGPLGSYEVRSNHSNALRFQSTRDSLERLYIDSNGVSELEAKEAVEDYHFDEDGNLMTDDFTPEQALTRMAYKVFGEII